MSTFTFRSVYDEIYTADYMAWWGLDGASVDLRHDLNGCSIVVNDHRWGLSTAKPFDPPLSADPFVSQIDRDLHDLMYRAYFERVHARGGYC